MSVFRSSNGAEPRQSAERNSVGIDFPTAATQPIPHSLGFHCKNREPATPSWVSGVAHVDEWLKYIWELQPGQQHRKVELSLRPSLGENRLELATHGFTADSKLVGDCFYGLLRSNAGGDAQPRLPKGRTTVAEIVGSAPGRSAMER